MTCDDASESHPVLSSDGQIAYATDAGSTWDIVVAGLPAPGTDPCRLGPRPPLVAGPGDQLWPAWVPNSNLFVYASTGGGTAAPDGGLGDLYLADTGVRGGTLRPLTSGVAADTRPDRVARRPAGRRPGRGGGVHDDAVPTRRVDGRAGARRRPVEDAGPLAPDSEDEVVFDAFSETFLGLQSSGPRRTNWGRRRARHPAPPWPSRAPRTTPRATCGRASCGGQAGGYEVDSPIPLINTYGQVESHPTWDSSFEPPGGEADFELATLVLKSGRLPPDVADVVAADGSRPARRRRQLRAGVLLRPGRQSADPGERRLSGLLPAGDRIVYSAGVTSCSEDFPEEGPAADRRLDDARARPVRVRPGGDGPGRPAHVVARRHADRVRALPAAGRHADLRAPRRHGRRGERRSSARGAEIQNLVDHGATQPTWSPDGERLAVVRSLTDSDAGLVAVPAPHGYIRQLWIVVVDADEPTAVPVVARQLDECEGEDCTVDEVVQALSPAWSPDGTRIAASSVSVFAPGTPANADAPGDVGILTLASATSNVVTRFDPVTGFTGGDDPMPSRALISSAEAAWSPDGTELAVTAIPNGRAHELGML